MATKTFYLKNASGSGGATGGSLQDGGTPPTAGITATGWTVAKLAAGNFSLMQFGTKKASTGFSTSDALTTPSLPTGGPASWRSENPLNGSFANTNWTLTFRMRAVSAASAQAGRIKARIWKSNADASGTDTQLTSSILTGTTTPTLSTTASQSSTVTWTPGSVITFTNEYLFVQVEWETTTAGGSNSSDAVFYIESTAAVVTSDFTPAAYTSKTWVKDAGSWKLATTYVRSGGVWKQAGVSMTPYVKKTGVWTQV